MLPNAATGVRSRVRHTLVLSPPHGRLRDLQIDRAIGEASRFPELGRTFYKLQAGHGRHRRTADLKVQHVAERGFLRLDDARFAAQYFIWLVY